MKQVVDWIASNPGAFASLVSAVVAASISLTIFSLTQLLARRRERTQLLIPKLEELYLLVNNVSADNAKIFSLNFYALQGRVASRRELDAMDDLDAYGHRTAKKIIMYIRLYFPKLERIHQLLFRAQATFNDMQFAARNGKHPELDEFVLAAGRVGHFLQLMEEEIIANRDHLLKDHFLPRRFKGSTREQIETETPPPPGLLTPTTASNLEATSDHLQPTTDQNAPRVS